MNRRKSRTEWGTYSKQNDVSDITTIPIVRRDNYFLATYEKTPSKYVSVDEKEKKKLGGSGFLDSLKEKLKSLPEYVSKASDTYSGDTGTALRNMIPASDDNARPGFAGEKHAILQLPNGKNGVANYMGPGTQVLKRLKRGDPGRTPSDYVAKRHDIDYVLASGEKTKEAQISKIREADNRMIKNLQKIRENKSDASRNIQMGMRLIQAKTVGEDLGLLNKSKFAGDLTNISASDKILLENERNKSQQNGYGADGKLLPGQKLKIALMKQQLNHPKKPRTDPSMDSRLAGSGVGSYQSMSKDLVSKKGYVLKGGRREEINIVELKRKGKKGKGLSPAGMGISLAGGEMNIISALKEKVLPKLLSTINLNIPVSEISKIIEKHLSNGVNKDNVMSLASELLPTLITYKLKQVKLNPTVLVNKGVLNEAIKGSGLKLAGQGKRKKMKGRGLIGDIGKLLGNVKDVAVDSLYKGLMEYIKNFIKGGNGLKLAGKGMIMTGTGFWSDFADGFKTGFVRTLDILSLPIKLLAPELAPAVDIGKTVGNILPGKMLF